MINLTILNAQCLSGEIYSFLIKQCLPCSSDCSDCFNINQDQCTHCAFNFLKSQSNTSTCVQKCQLGEVETQEQECIACQVEGCAKCDLNQNCLECRSNLIIDQVNNKCKLKQKVCNSELDFIYLPFTQDQCVQNCPSSYYQNQNTQVCEKTSQCIQIDSSLSSINQQFIQVNSIQQNLYIIRGSHCTFTLADQNFEILDIQFLQNISYSQSLKPGYNPQESFIIGKLGGCITNRTLTVIDFITRQITFQKQNLDLDYYVYYLDIQNQFVFFRDSASKVIGWYDAIKQLFMTKRISQIKIIGMFNIQNNNQTNYYFQIKYKIFNVAILQEDRSFQFLNDTLNLPQYLQLINGFQKRDYLIGIFQAPLNQQIVYKLSFKNATTAVLKLVEQIQMQQFQVYYSVFLNSILLYDTSLWNLQVLVLGQFSDQVEYSYNITSSQFKQFQFCENQLDNSTFVFFISDKLSFLNITDYLIKFQVEQKNITDSLLKVIDSPFITSQSNIVSIIFSQDNTVLIFLSQVLQINVLNNQLIIIQFNISDSTYLVQYFNPDQNQKHYLTSINSMLIDGQNQIQFSIEKNSFYVYDNFQIFAEQAIGIQKIQFNLQNLQRNPRINTRLINIDMEDQSTQINGIQIIGNNQFQINNFNDTNQFNNCIFIKKRNMLLIIPSFQLFSLDTGQYLFQDSWEYYLNIQDFVIINEDYIAYITYNQFYEFLLYLVDLQLLQNVQLSNLGMGYNFTFYKTDNFITPIIAFNDLIYLFYSQTQFQPYSLSQRSFLYQQTTFQFYSFNSVSLNYQKTGDIFIFYYSYIYIYSFDLLSFQYLKFDIYYPNLPLNPLPLINNQRYVFYYDQYYFYRFDMELKSINQLSAKTDLDLYLYNQVDFFALDENKKYIKKSEIIIDTENMIVIKSSLQNFNYIGSIIIEDNTQVDSFCSQNGVFWYLNLFNNPFSVFNITQNLIIQDIQLENNKIAIYDNINKYLIIYDVTKTIEQIQQIKISFTFDLSITIVDWDFASYFWIKDQFIYLQDGSNNISNQIVAKLDSNIQEYKYCPDQKIIVAKSAQQSFYSIQIQSRVMIDLNMNDKQLGVEFYVNCDEDIIVVYYPSIYLFDLKTGIQPAQFFQSSYLFNYRAQNTILYYDFKNQILIGVTGNLNQINIINIPGDNQLFVYNTVSQFTKDTAYFYSDQTSLIVVDNVPQIYFCNYLTKNITILNIEIQNILGILMDESKNIVFIYSNQFILIYQFPSMQFIETVSLQIYNDTFIQQVFLNTQLSLMIVLTQTRIISFDLTEILYSSETNLLQFQKIQSLSFNQQFQVSYSIVNLSINLYQNMFLIDTLLIEPSKYQIYPYLQELILMQNYQIMFLSYKTLYIIKVDLEQKKLIFQQKINLISMPDNYFYDSFKNQIFFMYQQNYQISSLNLNIPYPQEVNLINFNSGDFSQSLILSNYIIIPSSNEIIIYDFIQQQVSSINFTNDSIIKLIFKLQSKNFSDYTTKWWDIPFDFEERFNNNDSQVQNKKFLCLIIEENNNLTLQIANIDTQIIDYAYQINNQKIMNIVSDPFRNLIFLVNNQGLTLIFSYTLNLLTTLQNACLKQAKISYDSDFIYSICPSDIIIYNGLSFQQQYSKINQGLNEVVNFVNTKYNNYFLIIQKYKFIAVKLDFKGGYEVIFEINESYQILVDYQINYINQLAYLELLLSSYQGIQNIVIPLQQNQICSLNIQQQNRSSENIYTNIKLSNDLNFLQSQGTDISQIQQITVDNSNQVYLVQVQPLIIDNLQILSQNYQLQNMNITNSTDIWLISDAISTQISNIQILQLSISQNSFSIIADQLSISEIYLKNSKSFTNDLLFEQNDQYAFIQITNYKDCKIKNINSLNNQIMFFQINQQNNLGNTLIQSCQFVEFNLQTSLIELININNLIIDFLIVKNIQVNSTAYSSIILINQSKQVLIMNSQFKNNTNYNGYGGAIYSNENSLVQIQNTTFELNQCKSKNGGALSLINTIKQGSVTIQNSVFLGNQAKYSTGGAINLINSNMILKDSNITSNQALSQGLSNGNNITKNYALFYGKNIGSTIRSIYINLNDIASSESKPVLDTQNNVIQIKNIKSGDQILFQKVQFIDEEGNPLNISSINLVKYQLYSSDIQTLIDQLSASIQCDESNQQLKCIGQLQSKQFIDDGFKLNAQIIYRPLSQVTLQIISNNFPQILDSKGNIFIQQTQLYKNITFYFDDCELGQIYKQQTSSVYCEDCPEGKYSLNLQDNQCSICPESATNCYKSTILLRNGYWRENNQTNVIIYCNLNPEACQAESVESKYYCLKGYKGPLCYSCDTYGEIWEKTIQNQNNFEENIFITSNHKIQGLEVNRNCIYY
ncbi:hypothetical protein ABPG74_020185 [Tetrahymena malaccensis]